MTRRTTTFGWTGVGGLCVGLLLWNLGVAQAPPPEPPPKGHLRQDKLGFLLITQRYAAIGSSPC
jgi:hypothetical protein